MECDGGCLVVEGHRTWSRHALPPARPCRPHAPAQAAQPAPGRGRHGARVPALPAAPQRQGSRRARRRRCRPPRRATRRSGAAGSAPACRGGMRGGGQRGVARGIVGGGCCAARCGPAWRLRPAPSWRAAAAPAGQAQQLAGQLLVALALGVGEGRVALVVGRKLEDDLGRGGEAGATACRLAPSALRLSLAENSRAACRQQRWSSDVGRAHARRGCARCSARTALAALRQRRAAPDRAAAALTGCSQQQAQPAPSV